MTDLISRLNLPWKDKPNRSAFLRLLSRLGNIVRDDVNRCSRAFDAFTCDADMLFRHGEGLGVNENFLVDDYRSHVATAGYFLAKRGQKGQVYSFLDRIVPARFEVFEGPRDNFQVGFSRIGVSPIGGSGNYLIVKVRNLTPDEKSKIYVFLDQFLDPDIDIIILPLIPVNLENLTVVKARLYGGSSWIVQLYKDISEDVEVYVIPDDIYTVGQSRMGRSIVWGPDQQQERILIYTPGSVYEKVKEKSESIFDQSVNWEVVKDE